MDPMPDRPLTRPRRSRWDWRRIVWLVGALLLVAVGGFEVVKHGGWVAVAAVAGFVAPDLTFLAGIGAPDEHRPGVLPRRVVRPYNLVHRPLPPLVLLLVTAVLPVGTPWFALCLGWLTHIAVDRASGYGLRAADGTIVR
jgi:hypothetical protein